MGVGQIPLQIQESGVLSARIAHYRKTFLCNGTSKKGVANGMFFWSQGLGKRGHVVIPCGTEHPELTEEGKALKLSGQTLPPIVWHYTITLDGKDFSAIIHLGLHPAFLRFLSHPKRIRHGILLLFYLGKFLIRFLFAPPLLEQKEQKEETGGTV
jgi:hypothetical protein